MLSGMDDTSPRARSAGGSAGDTKISVLLAVASALCTRGEDMIPVAVVGLQRVLRTTRATNTLSAILDEPCVFRGELMPTDAMCLRDVLRYEPNASTLVLASIYRFEVIGIHAVADSAEVVKL
jgi:hypothetical protein